ncbi:glucose dehydrogenase [FAD, quinone]-like [Ceratina calcarata]|uniref:Glucose dehydrogenase [FAD, quinone]-like n=1 Tax=Ceratina calcarata TaxID=156304 RepID=A0AAJ7S8C1_9HYME|nr:glucose dehydrogenase [FAD, quinone]-like [Ceratina calcarata]
MMSTRLEPSSLFWNFTTLPSANYCISQEIGCNWGHGRALGGSSVVNSMMYTRGNRHDYDRWEEAGNPGWNYESVLPYFKKSEDMRIEEYQESPYHGVGGYLTVEYFGYYAPITEYFMEAIKERGYDEVDVTGANQTGFSFCMGTVRDGMRCSAAKAFLRPAWRRSNLHISTDSYVEKILVRDGEYKYRVVHLEFRFVETQTLFKIGK